MWSDPIADMLTRIRNATHVRHKQVKMPSSRVKVGIAKVLKEEGYIEGFDTIEDAKQGILRVDLKYGPRGEDVIHKIQRVSTGGRRIYNGSKELPKVLGGLGIAIVSTNKGVLSDRKCREHNVGGEVLCTLY